MLSVFNEFELQTCVEELSPGKYNFQLAIGEDECIYWELNPDCCDDAGGGGIFLKNVIGVNPLITDDEEIDGKLYNTYAEAAAYAVAQDPVANGEVWMIEFGAGDHTAENIILSENVHIKGQEYFTTFLGNISTSIPFNGNFFSSLIYGCIIQNLDIQEGSAVLLHNIGNLLGIGQITNAGQMVCIQDTNVTAVISTDNSNNIFIESRVDLSHLGGEVRGQESVFTETEFLDFCLIDFDKTTVEQNCTFGNEIEFNGYDIFIDDNSFINLLQSSQSNILMVGGIVGGSGSFSANIQGGTTVYLCGVKCEGIVTITVFPGSSLITTDCQNIKVNILPGSTWINDDGLINTTGFVNLDPGYFSRTVQELFDWIEANWPGAIPPIPQFKQQDFISALIEVADDKDYKLVVNAPYDGTIYSITTVCSSGNATGTMKINGVPLTLTTPNTISVAEDQQTPGSAQNFVAGDSLSFEISGNNFAEDVTVTVAFTRLLT